MIRKKRFICLCYCGLVRYIIRSMWYDKAWPSDTILRPDSGKWLPEIQVWEVNLGILDLRDLPCTPEWFSLTLECYRLLSDPYIKKKNKKPKYLKNIFYSSEFSRLLTCVCYSYWTYPVIVSSVSTLKLQTTEFATQSKKMCLFQFSFHKSISALP